MHTDRRKSQVFSPSGKRDARNFRNTEGRRTWDLFLLVAHLDKVSLYFHGSVSVIVSLDIFFQLLTTADGPYFHPGRHSAAHYPLMPNGEELFTVRAVLNSILALVAFAEVSSSLHQWYVSGQHYASILNALQLSAVVAFFVEAVLYPFNDLNQASNFSPTKDILAILQLFKIFWVLGFLNVLTEVQALMLTFRNSRRALLVPLAMLFITNSVTGAAIYFLEPCFDRDTCSFDDMYRSWFFGLVTMARVGYGDQHPNMFYTRVLVVVTMLLGGIFFAMPLAIITQKYDQAYKLCKLLKEEMRMEMETHETAESMESALAALQEWQVNKGNENENIDVRLDLFQNHNALIEQLTHFIDELEGIAKKIPNADSGDNMILMNMRRANKSAKVAINQREQIILDEAVRQGVLYEDEDDDNASVVSDIETTGNGPPRVLLTRTLPPSLIPAGKQFYVNDDLVSGSDVSFTSEAPRFTGTQKSPKIYTTPGKEPPTNRLSPIRPRQTVVSALGLSTPKVTEMREIEIHRSGLILKSDPTLQSKSERVGELASKYIVSEIPTTQEKKQNFIRRIRKEVLERDERVAQANVKIDQEKGSGVKAFPLDMSRCIIARRDRINQMIYQYTQKILDLIPNKETQDKQKGLKYNIQKAMRKLKEDKSKKNLMSGKGGRGALLKMKKVDLATQLLDTVEQARENSWRFQLFLLFEMPYSSLLASRLSSALSAFAIFSLFLFVCETLPMFHIRGESSRYCELALEAYCSDKKDPSLDAGCYSTGGNKLKYNCDGADCFGVGSNFGSVTATTLSCSSSDSGPFQEQSTLKEVTLFSSFMDFQRNSPLCGRQECHESHYQMDGNSFWRPLETALAFIFAVELSCRYIAATIHIKNVSDFLGFFANLNVVVDLVSILPFPIEVIYSLWTSSEWPDFNTISSLPISPGLHFVRFLKVMRLVKVGRHMRSVKIVVQTIKKSHKKVLVNVALLLLFSLPCGYLLYLIERGSPCFADGTDDLDGSACGVSASDLPSHWEGKYLMISKDSNSLSLLPNAFYGYWLTLVTITAEGYGRIYAITALGKLFTVILIICGSIYLSIPVAVMCDTFHGCFKKVVEDERKNFDRMRVMMQKIELKQKKGVRSELLLEAPPVLETGDPDVDKALMRSTVKNKNQLTKSIKELVAEYYETRELMARGILTAAGDGMLYVYTLRQALRKICLSTGKVTRTQKDMQLYRVMEQ